MTHPAADLCPHRSTVTQHWCWLTAGHDGDHRSITGATLTSTSRHCTSCHHPAWAHTYERGCTVTEPSICQCSSATGD